MENNYFSNRICDICDSKEASITCITCLKNNNLCEECDVYRHKNWPDHKRMKIKGLTLKQYTMDFRNKYKKNNLLSLRIKNCEEVLQFLETKGILLIKSPPGSGKTFFSDLFRFYLEFYPKSLKIDYINYFNCNQISDVTSLENLVIKDTSLKNFQEIWKENKEKLIYIIIDEAQKIYDEKYASFWLLVKQCSEELNLNVRFLCLSVYSDSTAKTSNTISTIVFTDKTKSLEFLRFNLFEINEIFESYAEIHPESLYFNFSKQMINLIFKETKGHPELVIKAIEFISNYMRNEVEKDIEKMKELIFSNKYLSAVIGASKGCPRNLKLNQEMIELLREIHIKNGKKILEFNNSNE